MQEVFDFLKKAKVYFLGTVAMNDPKVRPFGTVDIYENKLYIQTGKKKDVYKQIKENPRIEICAMYNNDWIRISATAIEDETLEASNHMLDNYPELKPMYIAGDGNCTVFYLTDVTATFFSFDSIPRLLKF